MYYEYMLLLWASFSLGTLPFPTSIICVLKKCFKFESIHSLYYFVQCKRNNRTVNYIFKRRYLFVYFYRRIFYDLRRMFSSTSTLITPVIGNDYSFLSIIFLLNYRLRSTQNNEKYEPCSIYDEETLGMRK